MVRERQTARKSTGASKKQLAAQAAAARRRRKKEERQALEIQADASPARTTGIVIGQVEAQPQPQSSRPGPPIVAQNTSVLDDAESARRAVSSLLNAQDRAQTTEIWDREGPSAGYKASAQALAYFEEAASRAQKTWEENVALKKEIESLRVSKGAAEEDLEKQRIYWIALEKERRGEYAALKKEIERLLAAKGAVEEDFEKQKTYWVALEKEGQEENAAMKKEIESLLADKKAAREELEKQRTHIVELEKKQKALEAKVNLLNQENLSYREYKLKCIRDWVKSKSFKEVTWKFRVYNYIKGYSTIRVKLHEMCPDLDLRKFRAFPGERLRKNGETFVLEPSHPPQVYFDDEERPPPPPPEPMYSQDEPFDDELLDPEGDPTLIMDKFEEVMEGVLKDRGGPDHCIKA